MPDYLGPRRSYDPWGRPLPRSRQAGPQRVSLQRNAPTAPAEPQRAAPEPDWRARLAELENALAAEHKRAAEAQAALAAERKHTAELQAAQADLRRRMAELEEAATAERERATEQEAALAAERDQAAELRGKAESYLDLAQRTQADFVNYKRRAERERADEAQAARADLLVQLLPALDDLERALSHVPESLRGNPWADGLPLVARQLRLALARAGVERLGAEGEAFDPRLHEAVAYQPQPGFAEGQIAHVARPGYRIGERIVRPAQVVVAQGGGQ